MTRRRCRRRQRGERHGSLNRRLIARGLDDALRGSAFAVVDGIDGRVHHLKLPDIEAAVMVRSAVLWLRRFDDARGRQRIALAVRSDFNLEQQSRRRARPGSTGGWSPEGAELSRAGFGARFALRLIGGSIPWQSRALPAATETDHNRA